MLLRSLLVLACLALSLTACGKKEAPAAGPAPAASPTPAAEQPAVAPAAAASPAAAEAPARAPQTVTLWHSYRDDERKALEELIGHWNKNHADLQINALAVPYDAIIDKFQVATPNGNGPDLIVMAHDKIGTWVRDGLIQPYGDFATPQRLQRFLPQTVRPLVFEKAIYGLPLAFKSLVLFYNKKMVKEPPQSLAQLVEVAKGFTDEKAGSWGLAYDAANLYFHAPFLHGHGGGLFDEATHKLTLNTPEAVLALEAVRKLHKEDKVLPKGMSGFVITSMFNDGKVPFVFQGPWFISEIDKGVEWGVAVLPTLDDGKPLKPFLGSEALLLAKPTKVRDAALQVADYLTSDEAALARLEHGHQMVANVKVYENPRWGGDAVVKVFRAQADQAVPMPNAAEVAVAWNPYNTALLKGIFGDGKPADLLAEAQRQADEALAKMGK